ncbi:MAG: M10 family metallopeptidase C-terminal domain-containing protein [Paracoccaceae bacterium]
MALFVVAGAGVVDLAAQDLTGFTGIDFQATGPLRVLLSGSQFGAMQLPVDAEFAVHPGFASIVEIAVLPGQAFTGAGFEVSSFGADDRFVLRDASGNEGLVGTRANDSFNITGGKDTVHSGRGHTVIERRQGSTDINGGDGVDIWIADFSDIAADIATSIRVDTSAKRWESAAEGIRYRDIEVLRLTGGAGNDIFTSGVGSPDDGYHFVFSEVWHSPIQTSRRDTIVDVQHGVDKIDLLGIFEFGAGRNQLEFIGGDLFTEAGQLRIQQNAGNTFIKINASGDLRADMIIQVSGLIPLDAGDFILV